MSVNPVISDQQLEELIKKAIAKRWPDKKIEVQESLAQKILNKMKTAQLEEAEAINQTEATAEAAGVLDDVLSTQAKESQKAAVGGAQEQQAADDQAQNEAAEDEAMSQLPEEETTQNEMEIRRKGGPREANKKAKAPQDSGADDKEKKPKKAPDGRSETPKETDQAPQNEAQETEEETPEEPAPEEQEEQTPPVPPPAAPKLKAPSGEAEVPVSRSKPIDLENEPKEEAPPQNKLDNVARKFAKMGYQRIDTGDGHTRFRRFDGQDVVYNDNGDFVGAGDQNSEVAQTPSGNQTVDSNTTDSGLSFELQRILAEIDATEKEIQNTQKKIKALMEPVGKKVKEMDGKNKEIKKLQYLMLRHMGEAVMLFLFGFICIVTIVLSVPGGFMIKEGASIGIKALKERTKIQNKKHELKPLKKQQEKLMEPVQQQQNILKGLAQKRNQLRKIANQIQAS